MTNIVIIAILLVLLYSGADEVLEEVLGPWKWAVAGAIIVAMWLWGPPPLLDLGGLARR
jgi:hypothetical protein